MSQLSQHVNDIVTSVSEATERCSQFTELVKRLIQQEDSESLKQLIDIILSDDAQFSLFSRPVLREVSGRLRELPVAAGKQLAVHTLERLAGRVVSFEEEECIIREHLADVLINEGQWSEAAKCLSAINLESGVRSRSALEKTEKYVKIAELYLEDQDPVSAETYCSRAAMIVHEVTDVPLQLRHAVCHARVLDSKRKFSEAAFRYYDLSQKAQGMNIAEGDLMLLLKNAVICAILSPAGPQRSRLLASIMKDERIRQVPNFEILRKMFLERIILPAEISTFSDSLSEHQKALLADGQTVVHRAILQHNLLAVSRVYSIIRFADLGEVLQVPAPKAEKVAARMIQEERLVGYIDQREGLIHFGLDENEYIKSWNCQIETVCVQLNHIVDQLHACTPNASSPPDGDAPPPHCSAKDEEMRDADAPLPCSMVVDETVSGGAGSQVSAG